ATEAIGDLVKLLNDSPDQSVVAESATALGAIAARKNNAEAEPVVTALLGRYAKVNDAPAVRDALVGAMADVADARFVPVFLKGLGAESASLRLACARGLGNVAPLPANAGATQVAVTDALIGQIAGEPDRGVRLALVAALAKHGPSKAALKAIYDRTNPNTEADEAVRKRAWDSLIELLKVSDKAIQLTWIGQIEADAAATAKLIDLLLAIEPDAGKSDQWTPADVAALSERLADAMLRANRPAEAGQRYEPAYQKLRAAKSDRAQALAVKYLQALVAADQQAASVGVLKDRLAIAKPAEAGAMIDCLVQRLRALIGNNDATGATAALAWINEVRKQLPEESKTASWADTLNKLADQAKAAIPGATSKPE
ncbi:MAG: hypothetical protein PHU85_07405, partial [Phycisphaerae bacterium]|nr:hypothetical protein [Phycisphaerae bacterium]